MRKALGDAREQAVDARPDLFHATGWAGQAL